MMTIYGEFIKDLLPKWGLRYHMSYLFLQPTTLLMKECIFPKNSYITGSILITHATPRDIN